MRTGFVILAHERLERTAALARHLAGAGAAVVVHVDRRVPEAARAPLTAGACDRLRVISTHATEWGMFGLVAATIDATREIARMNPDLRHVCLLSGSCLPVRPVVELDAFLAARPRTDFIETVPVAESAWVQDGLSEERFTLWHPLPWRRRRWLFDRSVGLQRRLGVRRRMPDGLQPRLGLQWWCLTMTSLGRMLDHPRFDKYVGFFRHCWIPDESFFQTLVPAIAGSDVEPRPLTLQRFDIRGRPVVFHDDHLDLLARTGNFFARKIDPDADALYDRFLNPCGDGAPDGTARGALDETPFRAARLLAETEGRGVPGPLRVPAGFGPSRAETARPYAVLVGEDGDRLQRARAAVAGCCPGIVLHGRLFGARPAEFACPGSHYHGNLSGEPALRDYRPAQFLARLLWADRDRPGAFTFVPADNPMIVRQIVGDPNARLVLIGGAGMRALAAASRTPRRAWHVDIDTAALARDLEGQGDGAELSGLACLLRGDWTDPTGWTVAEENA